MLIAAKIVQIDSVALGAMQWKASRMMHPVRLRRYQISTVASEPIDIT
jgi:hypothetical protein